MFMVLTTLYNLLIAIYHLLTPRHVMRLRAMRPRAAPELAHAPRVAVLVPMRDEVHNVRRCLDALLAQDYPAERYEIIVIDDGSTDGTGELLMEVQASRARWAHPRLRVLKTPPLKPGWTGKSQALWWGSQAVADTVPWLLFVDADTFPRPAALATTVREAQARDIHLLSLYPFEELTTWWEKVIYPVSLLQLLKSVDLRAINDDSRTDAAWANGQFLLVRHDAYIAVGTHEAVRGEMLESVALARRLRAAGYCVRIENGLQLVTTRMWEGLGDLWESYQKEGIVLYQGSMVRVALLTLAVAFMDLLPFLWPWVAIRRRHSRRYFLGVLAASMVTPVTVIVQRLRGARHFGISGWYAFTHPIGAGATLLIAWSSLLRLWFSRPVSWKGRQYLLENWTRWWTEIPTVPARVRQSVRLNRQGEEDAF